MKKPVTVADSTVGTSAEPCCPGASSCCPGDEAASLSGRLGSDADLLGMAVAPPITDDSDARTMNIRWQRLTDQQGETCDRCGTTEESVRDATSRLAKVLAPFGMEVQLTTAELGADTFLATPEESNRIWVAGKPLEELLDAKIGMSACGSCGDLCGEDAVCRTVSVGGVTYEAIPADLIVQAGLVAASDLIRDERPGLGLTYCLE